MRRLLPIVFVLAALPTGAVAQQAECDGAFHLVHSMEQGALHDLDMSGPGDGWAVGTTGFAPIVVRFNEQSFERFVLEHDHREASLISVEALAPDDVFAVGHSYSQDEIASTYIVHWDGSTWSEMDVPTPGRQSFLFSIDGGSRDDLWAVGSWDGRDWESHTLVLHYDGESWARVPAPSPGRNPALYDVDASISSDPWAVGARNVRPGPLLHWDGAGWTAVRPDVDLYRFEQFRAVAVPDVQNVWVVGESRRRPLILRGSGGEWKRTAFPNLRGPHVGFLDVLASGDRAWTAGYRVAGDQPHPLVAQWNGEWRVVPFEAGRYGEVTDLEAEDATTLWALGEDMRISDYESTELIERRCES
jgi:hypothetical protein